MKRSVLLLATIALFSVFLLPGEAAAQGRGRGGNSGWNRKCEKFVNCHDARDGRWDNRGPRRRTSSSRYYSPYSRNRVYDNNRYRRYNTRWRRY